MKKETPPATVIVHGRSWMSSAGVGAEAGAVAPAGAGPANNAKASNNAVNAWPALLAALVLTIVLGACGAPLPDDVAGYASDCIEMTSGEIPPHTDDPHDGFKRVYACNLAMDELVDGSGVTIRPFPEGALIVKSSRRENEDFPWLVATARKTSGVWEWKEYTRNFEDETLRQIPASESVCVDCHRDAESIDWIFSSFQAR